MLSCAPFYRHYHRGPERSSHLPEGTQQDADRARYGTQLHLNPNTCGYSCFPNLWERRREVAFLEDLSESWFFTLELFVRFSHTQTIS